MVQVRAPFICAFQRLLWLLNLFLARNVLVVSPKVPIWLQLNLPYSSLKPLL